MLRYVARPGVCLDRLALDEQGGVHIRFKRPWRNGTTGVRLAPEVFVLRLASLLLPGGVNLVRYHGVFAPAANGRAAVVPAKEEGGGEVRRSRWIRWSVLIERVFGRCPELCPTCG